MSKRYRVIVSGVGGIGIGTVRECARLPWIELVGAKVYSPEKHGRDIGELAGINHLGITATQDDAELLGLNADCVLYCGRDIGDHQNDEPIKRWLEGGVNVVTPLPFVFPEARGAAVVEEFTAAATRGGATLHGAGLNPGWISERLLLLASSLSHDIERIHVSEYFDMSGVPREFALAFGVGVPDSEAVGATIARTLLSQYLTPTIEYVCNEMEVAIDRIEESHFPTIASKDYPLATYTLEQGTVSMMRSRWAALSGGNEFYVLEGYWYAHPEVLPAPRLTAGSWTVDIEGRPSTHLSLDINASIARNEATWDGDPTPPGYYATVNVMIDRIPAVYSAPPGILRQPAVGPHFTTGRSTSQNWRHAASVRGPQWS
jgi:hypothetical protein